MNDSKVVGLSFISEKLSNTTDNFWMIISSNTLLNPFDFVKVENMQDTVTIGVVKEIKRMYINLNLLPIKLYASEIKIDLDSSDSLNTGITVANIDVIANFPSVNKESSENTGNINLEKQVPATTTGTCLVWYYAHEIG